ncbi:hypothetical protein V6Z12_A05G363200 [Gossypium hirsutum]
MTSTSSSIIVGGSQFINKPPYFNGANYSYWKTIIMLFIQANDLAIWNVIMDEKLVPKSKNEWNEEDKRSIQLNTKAMHSLFCTLGPDEYSRVSSCPNSRKFR